MQEGGKQMMNLLLQIVFFTKATLVTETDPSFMGVVDFLNTHTGVFLLSVYL